MGVSPSVLSQEEGLPWVFLPVLCQEEGLPRGLFSLFYTQKRFILGVYPTLVPSSHHSPGYTLGVYTPPCTSLGVYLPVYSAHYTTITHRSRQLLPSDQREQPSR